MYNYYCSSILSLAELQGPLKRISKGQVTADDNLKSALSNTTLLSHHSPEDKLYLYVDA